MLSVGSEADHVDLVSTLFFMRAFIDGDLADRIGHGGEGAKVLFERASKCLLLQLWMLIYEFPIFTLGMVFEIDRGIIRCLTVDSGGPCG